MGCGPTPSTYRPQHLNKQTLQRHDRGASSCRYCCKSPKLLGDNFLAIRRSDPRPPIFTVSITLPRSPVSLSSGDEVPHIFTRKSRLQPGEFLITSAKRLLQQNLPTRDSCTAANSISSLQRFAALSPVQRQQSQAVFRKWDREAVASPKKCPQALSLASR